MKKLFFILFFLTGCNYTGFSEEWKEAYSEECISEAQEYTSNNKAEAYCNCSLELIMEKLMLENSYYTNFFDFH